MTQSEITKRQIDGYNVMLDALSWFEAHEVEKKLGHLPQWVPMAREIRDTARSAGTPPSRENIHFANQVD